MDSAVPVKGDTQVIRSILLGTAGLSVAALAALWLTVVRDCSDAEETAIRGAVRVGAAALLLQGAHFTEELITGFDERFPQLLGLTPWSPAFFVPFNVFWVIVWTLGLWGLRSRRRAALFPLWFLALGSMGNGLAHPALAAALLDGADRVLRRRPVGRGPNRRVARSPSSRPPAHRVI